jgi:hypothetical protein
MVEYPGCTLSNVYVYAILKAHTFLCYCVRVYIYIEYANSSREYWEKNLCYSVGLHIEYANSSSEYWENYLCYSVGIHIEYTNSSSEYWENYLTLRLDEIFTLSHARTHIHTH